MSWPTWSAKVLQWNSGIDHVRRLIALPVCLAIATGVTLPEDGPLPAENPRPAEQASESPPIPEDKPSEDERPSDSRSDEDDRKSGKTDTQPSAEATKNAAKPDLPVITAPKPDEAALASCEAELRKLGAVFDRNKPLRGKNGCGIAAPYSVEQVIPGVSLAPKSQMRCETALALARWTDTVVVPAAEALPDEITLAQINHGSTYVCRRRNNSATGKMSEHAIGNAVDVMSFEFKGHDPIPVSPRAGDGTVEEAFQRAVRGGACLHFTTVLGPGSNASHADHLHLDIIKRRGGYRLCE